MTHLPSSSPQQLQPRPVPGALVAPRVLGLLLRINHLFSLVAVEVAPISLQSVAPKIWTSSLGMKLWPLALVLGMASTTLFDMDKLRTGTTWNDFGPTLSSNIFVWSLKTIIFF